MNPLDIAALAILALGFVTGLVRGLFREALALVNAGAAAFLALPLLDFVRTLIEKLTALDDPRTAVLAPWIAAFLLVWLFLRGVLLLLRARISKSRFRGDRLPGAVTGLLSSALLASVLLVIPAWAARPGTGFHRSIGTARATGVVRAVTRAAARVLYPPQYASLLDEVHLTSEDGR